jgi:2-keto-4-pentenoate hydratase/2-oxohepta-3-ene-1,7-dioic acid hydratase in catechol pathway
MRIANLAGRLVLIEGDGAADVAKASDDRFDADVQACFERWPELLAWVRAAGPLEYSPYNPKALGPPAPAPRQVFAIGLNYATHASEAGFAVPDGIPPVFTKFPTCLTGPHGEIVLPAGGHTDWEIELVAVIGRRAEHVPAEQAWEHVAGLTAGQDLSERISQFSGPAPQFSLAKSFPGFGPLGPLLVTPDEFDDPDDLALSTTLNGETVQNGRTSELLFAVSTIVERLSSVTPLLPGDVIFTGTPAGVGMGRTPPRWLSPGDELVSAIEGIGQMRHRMVGQKV